MLKPMKGSRSSSVSQPDRHSTAEADPALPPFPPGMYATLATRVTIFFQPQLAAFMTGHG